MQRHTVALRDLPHRFDRVNGAVRVFGCRAKDHHRMAADQRFELSHIGAQLGVERQQADLHAKVFRGLEPRDVGRARDDHLGFADAVLRGCEVAVGLDGEQAALGAARSHDATSLVRAVQQSGGDGDDVVLEPLEALECARVQAVGAGKRLIRLRLELLQVIVEVVAQAPTAALLVARIAAGKALELLNNLRGLAPTWRQARAHGRTSVLRRSRMRQPSTPMPTQATPAIATMASKA